MKQIKPIIRPVIFSITILFLTPGLKAQCVEPGPVAIAELNRCDVEPWLGGDGVPVPLANRVNFTIGGYWRVVSSNGIPDHAIGVFGIDPVIAHGRPTQIKEQNYIFVMPAYSSEGLKRNWPSSTIFEIPKPPFEGKPETAFGVAVNGVPFDPAAAEWLDTITYNSRVQYQTEWSINPLRNCLMKYDLDSNNGHVQPDSGYHYHGFPYGLFNKIKADQQAAVLPDNNPDIITRNRSDIVLLGWAFDGNPIYAEECGKSNDPSDLVNAKSSYKLENPVSGLPKRTTLSTPSTTDFPLGDFLEDFWYNNDLFNTDKSKQLDRCNGHSGPTPEFPDGIYHYHILEKTDLLTDIGFPYIGRCYRIFTYQSGPDIFPK
jgi:hypothetical protein